ncbi:MAG: hypothetical protein COA42_21565 [Alteromonadaceae bacterium]|nr:MAG: hypothetical protein COA42_21565 [Alteromonadaceae bacterium]
MIPDSINRRRIFGTLFLSLQVLLSIGCSDSDKTLIDPRADDAVSLGSTQTSTPRSIERWPTLSIPEKNPEVEKKIQQILNKMTFKQKVAQIIQPGIRHLTFEEMRQYGFGSYLNGGSASPNNDKRTRFPITCV